MTPDTEIFKAKTSHTAITIRQKANVLELYSGGDALQSAINLEEPHKLELKNLTYLMGILLFITDPKEILLLGTGGGSLIHFLRQHYPNCMITAVDIDAELLEIMHQHMLLPEPDDNLRYIVDDALNYLNHSTQHFDLILCDIFINNQPPPWLLKKDTMQALHNRIKHGGGLTSNLLINSDHEYRRYYHRLQSVFGQQTLCLPLDELDNTITFGVRSKIPLLDMSSFMQKAMQLEQQQGINYLEILSVIYASNPC
ncbi:MAG: methyltransferase domain-containing protein [Gammaproteobacteria bacterium]|nr:methyltransferase domain-containing protein [Gammaproteobacteria bacterium]